ncbi:ABC transporter permease [Spirochaeta cellobiosiphila]|uniref:ABC transporter permease n=1 Tax=Spirochaeta cellobiosiphila TaxID=504483 RepID=UPI0003F7D0B7|nr:proline/glycine betaine ABC transporter permease [Spirochaeta cellobiosiphila]
MFDFPEFIRFPVRGYIDAGMKWLLKHCSVFFDALGWLILHVMNFFTFIFTSIPWFVLIIVIFLLGWKLMKSLKTAFMMSLMLFIIGGFGYWELAMQTLGLVSASVMFSLLIGIPTGVAMAQSDRSQMILKPILDGMQTMPSFVYLIPALMFFGLGKVPSVIATIIYAVPPVIRLTNVGIRTVDKEAVEAAKAFGAKKSEILWDVQLPLAKPSIMVGINQTTMMALAMVVIGSMIGAKGLGMEVLMSISRIDVGRGFEAGISIVFLAIIIDRITHTISQNKK